MLKYENKSKFDKKVVGILFLNLFKMQSRHNSSPSQVLVENHEQKEWFPRSPPWETRATKFDTRGASY